MALQRSIGNTLLLGPGSKALRIYNEEFGSKDTQHHNIV
jgi:hypothetical protein